MLVNLTERGNIKTLHLTDFGTAKEVVQGSSHTVVYTLGYAAPEVFSGKYDPFKADSNFSYNSNVNSHSLCLWNHPFRTAHKCSSS